jgi:hypothetical protein
MNYLRIILVMPIILLLPACYAKQICKERTARHKAEVELLKQKARVYKKIADKG